MLGGAKLDLRLRCPASLARANGGARLDRPALAEGIWRRRTRAIGRKNLEGGDGADRRPEPALQLRHLDARARAPEVRQRRPEDTFPARDRARRNPLVPG